MQSVDSASYYGQGTDVQLLIRILDRLETRTVIDVGAEKGTFIAALLKAGADMVYAFEPYPGSVEVLRAAYGEHPSVRVFDFALGAHDTQTVLHVVEDKSHQIADAYHSLVAFDETPTLRIVGEIPVQCRALDSLVAEGVVPRQVGIVKIDTERNDLAVLQGMGRLFSPVVMLEYWDDLPETVGPAAYQVSEVVKLMADRGYANYVVAKRHDQFETLLLNADRTRPGDWGNLIFVHDTVFPSLSPLIFESVAEAQIRLTDKARVFASEAEQRLAVIAQAEIEAERSAEARERLIAQLHEKDREIAELTATAEERLRLVEEANAAVAPAQAACEQLTAQLQQLTAQVHEKERIIGELTATAAERLHLIEQTAATCEQLTSQLQEKERLIGALTTTAAERLRLIEGLNVEAARAVDAHVRVASELRQHEQTIAALRAAVAEQDRVIEGLKAGTTRVPGV